MLILGRRVNEAIQIGTDIEITVIDLQAGMVRLGINAPRRTRVWRKEVWDGVVDANRKAARSARLFAAGALEFPDFPGSGLSRLRAARLPERSRGRNGSRERGDAGE